MGNKITVYFNIQCSRKYPHSLNELVVLLSNFFSGSVLVTNIHIVRMLLIMNISVFKFAVWMWVGWEVGKVILHGNSSPVLKIIVNGNI